MTSRVSSRSQGRFPRGAELEQLTQIKDRISTEFFKLPGAKALGIGAQGLAVRVEKTCDVARIRAFMRTHAPGAAFEVRVTGSVACVAI
jgi:hypothetical protein